MEDIGDTTKQVDTLKPDDEYLEVLDAIEHVEGDAEGEVRGKDTNVIVLDLDSEHFHCCCQTPVDLEAIDVFEHVEDDDEGEVYGELTDVTVLGLDSEHFHFAGKHLKKKKILMSL